MKELLKKSEFAFKAEVIQWALTKIKQSMSFQYFKITDIVLKNVFFNQIFKFAFLIQKKRLAKQDYATWCSEQIIPASVLYL